MRAARIARALSGLLLLAGPAHAGREDDLHARVMSRIDLLNRAVERCQRRIAADEIDECDVSVTWQNRSVSMGEARSLANQMLASLRTQSVTVKSFIHHIDLSSLKGPERGRAEKLFAQVTNRGFSEQPATTSRTSGDFRLFSNVRVTATCRGESVDEWQFGALETVFGTEFGILGAYGETMTPLGASPSPGGSGPVGRVEFSYAIKGRPNKALLPGFQTVFNGRSCSWIWHRVQGTLACRNGRPELSVQTSGSRFPSHRTWINERQLRTIDQGAFSTLWDCDPHNAAMVR